MDSRDASSRGVKRPHSYISRETASPFEYNTPTSSLFSPPLPRTQQTDNTTTPRQSYWHISSAPATRSLDSASTIRLLSSTSSALFEPSFLTMPRPTPPNNQNANGPEIIDLTADDEPTIPQPETQSNMANTTESNISRANLGTASRAPRFPDNIADWDEEVQFISSRPIPQSRQPTRSSNLRPRQEEADVEITSDSRLDRLPSLLRNSEWLLQRVNMGLYTGFEGVWNLLSSENGVSLPLPAWEPFIMPQMDYSDVGYDISLDMEPIRNDTTSPPFYSAPPPVKDGFTRSPLDDDELICPKCEGVLCEGDTDLKRQVWAVKTCGHVYCGECTQNRYASKVRRTKGTTTPINSAVFKECVVEGCKAKTSSGKKAMFQVFI